MGGVSGTDTLLDIDDLVGRSVVIHAEGGGAPRVACGDIVRTATASGGGAHALIDTGAVGVSGRVQFTQSGGDVDVAIHLRYGDGTSATSTGHSWHVHEDQVRFHCCFHCCFVLFFVVFSLVFTACFTCMIISSLARPTVPPLALTTTQPARSLLSARTYSVNMYTLYE